MKNDILETICLIVILFCFLILGGGRIHEESLELRPYPDAAEQAYAASQLAVGRSPLLPVGHEFHPSRYSLVHPAFQAIWIVINGGRWQAIHTWSPVAILLGCLFFHLFLCAAGARRITRLLATVMIVTSTVMIGESQFTLQEPTIWLLFAAACLSWQLAMRRPATRLLLAAGIASGALVAIRPTYGMWPALLAVHGMVAFRREGLGGFRKWWTFWPGLLGIIVTFLAISHHLTGHWALTLYGYWEPTDDFLRLSSFFKKRVFSAYPDEAFWQRIAADVVGLRTGLTTWGAPFSVLLLLACPFTFMIWRHDTRNLLPVLIIFAIGQILVHCCYLFYAPRFLIPAFFFLVAAGCVGWQMLALESRWPSRLIRRRFAIVLGLVFALFLVLGTRKRCMAVEDLYRELARNQQPRRRAIEQRIRSYVADAPELQKLRCPIFVNRVNPLFLRLCANMSSHQLIYQLEQKANPYYDSAVFLLPRVEAEGRAGQLRPFEISLISAESPAKLRENILARMLSEHGTIAIYGQRTRPDRPPAFPSCETVDLSSSHSLWRLTLVRPAGAP